MTPRELQLAVDAAQDLNNKAMLDVIGLARSLTAKRREGLNLEFPLIDLAIAVDLQRETEQRHKLAKAALEERALSARLQSGNEERR